MMQCEEQKLTREDRRELEHNIKEQERNIESSIKYGLKQCHIDEHVKELRRLRRMR